MADMLFLCCVLAVTLVLCSPASFAEECSGSKPADIVFLIDGSGSVGGTGFNQTLSFISRMVDAFPIGPTKSQFGLLVFGTELTLQFHLNAFHDKIEMKRHIQNTPYPDVGGQVIARAFMFVRTDMFQTNNGMRDYATKIAIIITDGQSADKPSTKKAASELKTTGVTIYAIGVGNGVNDSELRGVASDDSLVYSAFNFSTINSLTGPLAQATCAEINKCDSSPCEHGATCVDQKFGYECRCPSGYQGLVCETDINECESNPCRHGNCTDLVNDVSCSCTPGYTGKRCTIDIDECASSPCLNGGTCLNWVNEFSCECAPRYYGVTCDTGICQPTVADLVFVLDSSVSQSQKDFNTQLDFIINFIDHIIIGEENFQVSVLTFSFDAQIEFGLEDYRNNATLKSAVQNITYKPGATFTDKGLARANDVFDKVASSRRNGKIAKRYVFVLTDGMSSDRKKTKDEAIALKKKVTKVIAIGIGGQVSHRELLDIASPGDYYSPEYVFSVSNFNSLYSVIKQLVDITCDECTNSSSSEVVFLFDMGANMNDEAFDTGVDALTYIVEKLILVEADNSVKLGLSTFDEKVTERRNLNDSNRKEEWLPFLQTLFLPMRSCHTDSDTCQGQTILHRSLQYAREHMFSKATMPDEDKVRKIIVLLSNGKLEIDDLLKNELDILKSNQIHIFVIALGNELPEEDISVLLSLVTDPNDMFLSKYGESQTHLNILMAEFVFNSCDLSNDFKKPVP